MVPMARSAAPSPSLALARSSAALAAPAPRPRSTPARNANGVVEATNVPDSPGFRLTYPGKGTLIHSRGFHRARAYSVEYDHHIEDAAAAPPGEPRPGARRSSPSSPSSTSGRSPRRARRA